MSDNKNLPFRDPFERNHCQCVALACMFKGPDAMLAASIASVLRKTKTASGAYEFFLDKHGYSSAIRSDVERAAAAVGLRVTARKRFIRCRRNAPTPKQRRWYDELRAVPYCGRVSVREFAAAHKRGRWLVVLRGHCVAVVRGRVRGTCDDRSQPVFVAYRMSEAK